MRQAARWAMILGAAVLGSACGASAPRPNDPWAAAQADIGRAEAGGAPNVPDAKLHLQLAREDLQKSKEMMGGDDRRATSLSSLASVEAQLALSLAKQAAAQEMARQAEGSPQKGTGQ
jgi:hypothetical protein